MNLFQSDRGPNEEKQKKSKKGGNSKQTSKAGQQKGGGGKDATKTTANQPKDVTKPATNQQKAQRGKLTINDIKDTSTITDENAPGKFVKSKSSYSFACLDSPCNVLSHHQSNLMVPYQGLHRSAVLFAGLLILNTVIFVSVVLNQPVRSSMIMNNHEYTRHMLYIV